MSACKLFLCLLLFVAVLEIGLCVSSRSTRSHEPSVSIRNTKDVSSAMASEAAAVLKEALMDQQSSLDPCEVLGIYFKENYPDFTWHVVDFNGYYVHSVKSISLSVNDDKYYLLFATNH